MSKDKLQLPLHGFKVHTPNLLKEVVDGGLHPSCKEALRIPILILVRYLESIAVRCSEINDPILNKLMCETTLYEVSDPESDEYDINIINKILKKAKIQTKTL